MDKRAETRRLCVRHCGCACLWGNAAAMLLTAPQPAKQTIKPENSMALTGGCVMGVTHPLPFGHFGLCRGASGVVFALPLAVRSTGCACLSVVGYFTPCRMDEKGGDASPAARAAQIAQVQNKRLFEIRTINQRIKND